MKQLCESLLVTHGESAHGHPQHACTPYGETPLCFTLLIGASGFPMSSSSFCLFPGYNCKICVELGQKSAIYTNRRLFLQHMRRKHPECGGARGRAPSGPEPRTTKDDPMRPRNVTVIHHVTKQIGKGRPGPGRGHRGPMRD